MGHLGDMNEMQISDLQANFSYCLLRYIFAMRRKLLDRSEDKSSLVYVMARSHEAASHHLSQYRPNLYRHLADLGHNQLSIEQPTVTLQGFFTGIARWSRNCLVPMSQHSIIWMHTPYESLGLDNANSNHNKTVCIFLGVFSTLSQ